MADQADEEFEISTALADRLLAHETSKTDYCAKKATYLNIFGLFGVGLLIYLHWYKEIRVVGSPPTFLGFSSSERLLWSCPMAGALELVGFFALNHDITSVIFAMVYLFAVTRGLYDSAFVISRAWNSEEDDFNDVVEFTKFYYHNISRRKLPLMIENYQREKVRDWFKSTANQSSTFASFHQKCCGWGLKYHWMKWAKELNTTDLPDSCCKVFYPGCGKGIIPRRPSGYLTFIEKADELVLESTLTVLETRFDMRKYESKRNEINRYWKKLFPDKDKDKFGIWNPTEPVPSWYLRLIDEEFAAEYEKAREAPPRTLAILIGTDKVKGAKSRALIYNTQGLEEEHRIKSIVHEKPCETTAKPKGPFELPDKARGVDPMVDHNIIKEVRKVMEPVRYYGFTLGFIYIFMFLVFFNYFQNIKANQLALDTIPVDFQDTHVTSTGFMAKPFHYISRDVYEVLTEKDENKRIVSRKVREDLGNRYNLILGLHKLGLVLKQKKIKQPRAPKDPEDPVQVDRYQVELLARLPPKYYPAMVDRFTQEPHPSGARTPLHPGYQGGLTPDFNGAPPKPHHAKAVTSLAVSAPSDSSASAKANPSHAHRHHGHHPQSAASAPNLSRKSRKLSSRKSKKL